MVFGLVRAQVRSGQPGQSPQEFEARAVVRREAAQAEALRLAGRGPAGPVRRRILRATIDRVHLLTVYRENQRYHLDYLLDHLHLLLLEQGRRLVARGVLLSPEDVFLLSGPTFWGLVDDGSGASSPRCTPRSSGCGSIGRATSGGSLRLSLRRCPHRG